MPRGTRHSGAYSSAAGSLAFEYEGTLFFSRIFLRADVWRVLRAPLLKSTLNTGRTSRPRVRTSVQTRIVH